MSGMGDRTGLILGEDGLERLREAHIVLAGAGAVGGYALEGLVRAGIGYIRVVDADVFSESNLNRQILATVDTIGRSKSEVACERARSINPDVDIEGLPLLISEETIPEILDGCEALVDAIDTVRHKTALIRAAVEMGIPVYSSMGAALHTDPLAVRIDTLKKTSVCPVASAVRKALRDMDTSDVTCVYSVEPPVTVPTERDGHGKSVLGSLPTIPAVFGMTLANCAVMRIAGSSRERGSCVPHTVEDLVEDVHGTLKAIDRPGDYVVDAHGRVPDGYSHAAFSRDSHRQGGDPLA